MQKPGSKTRIAAAFGGVLVLAFCANAACAVATPADLPLDQVMKLLRDAGIGEAWSITQAHSLKPPWMRSIEALSNREDLGDGLCRSREADLDLVETDGKITIEHVRKDFVISFSPWACAWGGPENFHHVDGPTDLAALRRLEEDLRTIERTLEGAAPARVKVTFDDNESRKLFTPDLRTTEIDSIYSNHNGHSQFCFFTKGKDIINAPETLGVEVVRGAMTELKVDICGVIDLVELPK